jgi:predicted Zn-dependent protease
MHISLSPPSSSPEARPRRALLEADLAWLREELTGAKTPEQRASILYQLGVLEQLAGRDPAAVRQLLAAVNTVAHFKEPLERLIALIERHRSFKNLPTLLDHLCRTAEGGAEVARARLASAWCALSHGRDAARALGLVELALEASPSDPAALLSLEMLARRVGDDKRARRALAARLERASEPVWAALLALELAERHAAAGEFERAHELARDAAGRESPLAIEALELCARFAERAGRLDWAIAAHGARAQKLASTLGERDISAAPLAARDASEALDAWLAMARLQRSSADLAGAFATLERAAELDPMHPVIAGELWDLAVHARDHERLEALVARELATHPSAAEAAFLWLGLASSRAERGQADAALAALRQALEREPMCWVARVRELDLLRERADLSGRARALEQLARDVRDETSKGRFWLLTADAWARDCRVTSLARDALEQAERCGIQLSMLRRLERALAHAAGDREWYAAATLGLLAGDLDETERAGLELEAWRLASLAGDRAASARLAALEASPGSARVARIARAYALDGDARDALARLVEHEPEPQHAAALGWALALRARSAGDLASATEQLAKVHARHPEQAVVAGTLSAWLRESGDPLRSAAVLRTTALALNDEPFAASLLVEAGLSCWWAGDREGARRDFEAAERSPRSARAGTLSQWVRRAAAGPGSDPESALADAEERLFGALERATSTPTPGLRELNDLNTALRAASSSADDAGLLQAARLSTLVIGRLLGVRSDPAELERAAQLSGDFAHLIDGYRYLETIGQSEPAPRALIDATRRWADGDGGAAAALEWVAASARAGQRSAECEARLRLAEHLGAGAREAVLASAALIVHLTRAEPAPWVDGASIEVALTNLETSPPGSDPRRRARALERAGEAFGADVDPMTSLLRGYNLLAAGESQDAIGAFRRYTDTYPEDPSGWEGLLAAARRGDDAALLAEAAATLGNTSRDPAHAARLFEEAAAAFLDQLGDDAAGRAALARAVELDPSRASSFRRLFELVRDGSTAAELASLIERRLPHASDPGESLALGWELARARRRADDMPGALRALDDVLDREPMHPRALALSAEIAIALERYADAVAKLTRLAESEQASAEERLTGGLAAVDLCENRLGSTDEALRILAILERAGLATLAVRERFARSAAKAGDWDQAVSVLERLMFERKAPEERAEAARLALVIHRDRRNDPAAAGLAAKVLLGLLPDDAEVLDLVLTGVFPEPLASELLAIGKTALASSTALDPTNTDALRRLSRIAERLGDVQLRQSTVGALVALGEAQDRRAELVSIERRMSTLPPSSVSGDVLAELLDPEDHGPIPELLSQMAPYLAEAFGPPREAFEVSRRERVSPRAGLPLRDEIAAWVAAFGLGEFELYVSPLSSERIVVLGGDPLSIIAGASVTTPLGPFQRLMLARALYARRRGLAPLLQLDAPDVVALIGALCTLGKVSLSRAPLARQRDFERQLTKLLPRKARKLLPERARDVRTAEASLDDWVRAASATLDRVAAVAVGDPSVILADAPARESDANAAEERTRRLLRFMLSPNFESLRQRFGVSVR